MQILPIILHQHAFAGHLETSNTYQVSEAVFPAFHMRKHIMLQTGDGTEFALVVWGDRFTGAAVLPHILKTCRHVMVIGHAFN